MDFFRKHSEAVIGVVIYLVIVLILLLFLGFHRPDPVPAEEGIVMDFGGSGSGTPDPGPANPVQNKPTQNNTPTNVTPNESLMTQSTEESVSVPTNPNPTESEEQTENNVVEEETETVNETVSNLLNTNWGQTSNTGTTGTGAGNPGDGGSGDGGTGNGSGSGTGNVAGNGWALAGRSAQKLPKPSVANCDGYVIVNITVDKTGKVISASFKPGGCTACDEECVNKAVASAKQARFNPDPNAAIRQEGTITYNFRPQ